MRLLLETDTTQQAQPMNRVLMTRRLKKITLLIIMSGKDSWTKGDDEECNQEWLTKKSPKPSLKEPVNTRVRNWMLAMRRNMKPEVTQAALRPFTITRERLHEVRSYSL